MKEIEITGKLGVESKSLELFGKMELKIVLKITKFRNGTTEDDIAHVETFEMKQDGQIAQFKSQIFIESIKDVRFCGL